MNQHHLEPMHGARPGASGVTIRLTGLALLILLLASCGSAAKTPAPDTPAIATATPSSTLAPVIAGTTGPTATLQPTSRPTSTLAPTSTLTPTPAPRLDQFVPTLVSPANGSSANGRTTFTWSWNGPTLGANQAFEVRIWKEGQADHFGAGDLVKTTSVTLDLNQATGVRQGGSGTYLWTVAVVQSSPYKRIGKEASPRTLQIGGVPPTPSRSAAPVIGPDALRRFASALGILSGSLLLAWLTLAGPLDAWLRRGPPR